VRTVYSRGPGDAGVKDGDGATTELDGTVQPCAVLDDPQLQQTKLSSLATASMSQVFSHQITADGSRLVYIGLDGATEHTGVFVAKVDGSDLKPLPITSYTSSTKHPFALSPGHDALVSPARSAIGYYELFFVKLDGTGLAKVSGPLAVSKSSSFSGYRFTPDGQHVVYLIDQLVQGRKDLFISRVDGTGWTRLSGSSLSGAGVVRFDLSAGSERVIYENDEESAELPELYSVKLDGTGKVKLNGAMVSGGKVWEWSVSGTTKDVVYRADQETTGTMELYGVKTDGSGRKKISALTDATGDVNAAQISRDGSRVVFTAKQTSASPSELYSVQTDGTQLAKLSSPLTPGAGVYKFWIDDQSKRVVYRARHSPYTVDQLWGVDIGGGAPVRLNGDLVAGGAIYSVELLPDGSRVLYSADQLVDGRIELFSAELTTGTWVKLNPPLPANSSCHAVQSISADSSWVAFTIADATGKRSLHLARSDGSSTTQLSTSGQNVRQASISAVGRVVYEVEIPVYFYGKAAELYTVDLSGGNAKLVSPSFNIVDVTDFAVSPDGNYLVYRTDHDPKHPLVGRHVLYAVNSAGGASSRLSSPQTDVDGRIWQYLITPDSSRVLYTADETTENTFECYSVKPDGTGRITVHPPGNWGLDNWILGFSAASKRVLFHTDHANICGGSHICSSKYLDGSGVVGISAPGAMTSYIDPTSFSGGKVLYVAMEGARHEAFLSDDDGSSKVKVSGPLSNPEGDVVWARISPDHKQVVYVADAEVDQRFELYIGQADGSKVVKLSQTTDTSGVAACDKECMVRFSPDLRQVAYVTGDEDAMELTVVDVNGGGSLRLVGAGSTQAKIEAFEVSPDSKFIVFVGDPEGSGDSGLYTVNLDGTAVTRLTAPLGPLGLESFKITGDSQRIVYAADEGAGHYELFSVRPDGSQKKKLHCELLGGGVTGYLLVDTLHAVLYTAPQNQTGTVELYGTKVDGTGPVYRLNRPSVAGGTVVQIALAPDTSGVLFQGSVEQKGVLEAYRVPVPEGLLQQSP
jgi:Tol biopolymer transport system component